MSRVIASTAKEAVKETARALSQGELAVIPTDTVYGLAARPDEPEALRKLFEAKGRPRDLAVPVLVSGVEQAAALGVLSERALRLAGAFWPGALTIVVARSPGVSWNLGGDGLTVGVRAPDHPFVLSLLKAAGPLAATSANPSGAQTPATVEELVEVFGGRVAVYVDEGPSTGSPPSTVVSLAEEESKLLRQGAIGWGEIRQVLWEGTD